MTLAELCEPLFKYVCRLNRAARSGGADFDFDRVRAEVADVFRQMRKAADADAALVGPFEKVEPVLIFFVDYLIASSSLPCAAQWREHRLAFEMEPPVMNGDTAFFEHLEQTLRESGEHANERLAVFYLCIGLGFTGSNAGKPDVLRKFMRQIAPRIGKMIESDNRQICPEAYEKVDRRDLIEKGARPLWGFGLVLAVLLVALFIANVMLFHDSQKQLDTDLNRVIQASGTAAK